MAADSPDTAGGGFLARWSRRKVQERQGQTPASAPAAQPVPGLAAPPAPIAAAPTSVPAPAPTLADLAQIDALDASADFSRFIQPEVAPALKNAALRKLFSDPHFNVMDGLDTYIEDYSLPDPLPAGMLERMALQEYLGLPSASPELLAQIAPTPERPSAPAPAPPEIAPADENADLRLQPHDAAGRPDSAPNPGEHAGRLG